MNKETQKVMFSSDKMDWETPQDFFDNLNLRYGFTLDAAANEYNAKCDQFFSINDDALEQDWSSEIVWVNPPYGRSINKWIKKGYEESQKNNNTTVVMLIPARTDTKYWHEYCMRASEVYFVKGRLKFVGGPKDDPAPFPSAVVVFRKDVGFDREPLFSCDFRAMNSDGTCDVF